MGIVIIYWERVQDDSSPAFLAALVDRLITEGMLDEADGLLAAKEAPMDPQLEAGMMRILLLRNTDATYREFQGRLIDAVRERPEIAEPLVHLLDHVPQENLLPATYMALAAWHEKQGLEEAIHRLRLARCQMAAERDRAEEIFQKTLTEQAANDRIAAARWCVQIRRYEQAKSLLANLNPTTDAEAFQLLCTLHEEAGDTDAWFKLLASPPSSAFLPAVYSDQAFLARRTGDSRLQAQAETHAIRAAAGMLADDSFVRLARHAEKRELDDLAHRAWIEAIRKKQSRLPLSGHLRSLIESLAAAKKESDLLELLTAYRPLEPANPVIAVQFSYLSCLNGRTTPEQVIRDLSPLHDRMPDAISVSCVLALAHLLENRPTEALALTDALKVDELSANPSDAPYLAIRGVALAANGRHDEAQSILKTIPWQALLPSERRTLTELARLFSSEEIPGR
jgi:hypothetical protein